MNTTVSLAEISQRPKRRLLNTLLIHIVSLIVLNAIFFLQYSYATEFMHVVWISIASSTAFGIVFAWSVHRNNKSIQWVLWLTKQLSHGKIPPDFIDLKNHPLNDGFLKNIFQYLGNFFYRLNNITHNMEEIIEDAFHSNQHLQKSMGEMTEGLEFLLQKVTNNLTKVQNLTAQIDSMSDSIQDSARSYEEFIEWVKKNSSVMEGSVSAMEKIFEAFDESNNHLNNARIAAEKLVQAANEGDAKVAQTLTAMKDIKKAEENAVSILRMITNIADQTNLLSMNASIEAAKAGTSGRGFSIVANEIRKLANNTTKRAEEIQKLIHEIDERTEFGLSKTEETVESINRVKSFVNENNTLFEQIDIDNKKEEDGIMQIAQDLAQSLDSSVTIQRITQQQAENVKNITLLIETVASLLPEVKQLNDDIINGFKQINEYAETATINVKLNLLIHEEINQLKAMFEPIHL